MTAKTNHQPPSTPLRMVDISTKGTTNRRARAAGYLRLSPEAAHRLRQGTVPKGDVLAAAQVAAILAAKRTPEWIPLCHSVPLQGVEVIFEWPQDDRLRCVVIVQAQGQTGVEMEALTAVSAALLTVYDMLKALDKNMVLEEIALLAKSGGRSGHYVRPGDDQHAQRQEDTTE